ncbi:hypothetical protein ACFVUS_12080 [Nocardia sp. NPDC058058]|uniref:hypothetical protein n=1 Tax=Nocardia sp. NPDC058058 TaxID=3346317 RepID=UPI0036DCC3E3
MNPLPKRRPRRPDQITGLPTARPRSGGVDQAESSPITLRRNGNADRANDHPARRIVITRPEGVGVWSELSGGIAAARERGRR